MFLDIIPYILLDVVCYYDLVVALVTFTACRYRICKLCSFLTSEVQLVKRDNMER